MIGHGEAVALAAGTPAARDRVVAVTTSKIKPNSPILRINHEFNGIMVNKGRTHRELRNFLT